MARNLSPVSKCRGTGPSHNRNTSFLFATAPALKSNHHRLGAECDRLPPALARSDGWGRASNIEGDARLNSLLLKSAGVGKNREEIPKRLACEVPKKRESPESRIGGLRDVRRAPPLLPSPRHLEIP